MKEKIAVIGLGYVGLPLALELAKRNETVGFDINPEKIKALRDGIDVTSEGLDDELKRTSLRITCQEQDLHECTFFIVGVPTPVDANNNPDLNPLLLACDIVGRALKPDAVVVFESTVYPGVTEDVCGPRLQEVSGLKQGVDFKLGYSPERINPGDLQHTLVNIVKVVSGQDDQTLDRVAALYESIIVAGVHRAPSIKVAEAAKVIENTQRDLNIALMNELAIIFDRMGIATRDVLDAAGTKWNFLRFSPGLVGGHCIGVDPYYLTTKAELLKYHPQVILAGRRINDGMGSFIAQRLVKLMINAGISPRGARIGILGITFKENVADIRNSRIPDIIRELQEFGVELLVHDPLANGEHTFEEYGVRLVPWSELSGLDGLVLAVSHREFLARPESEFFTLLKRPGVFIDVKSVVDRTFVPDGISYWSL